MDRSTDFQFNCGTFHHRYHVVWATSHRYKILQGPMRERIHEIIRQSSAEMGVPIIKGVLARDHVHMFINVPPKLALSAGMRRIKGRSSRRVQMEVPELRKRSRGQVLLSAWVFFDQLRKCYRRYHASVSGLAFQT